MPKPKKQKFQIQLKRNISFFKGLRRSLRQPPEMACFLR